MTQEPMQRLRTDPSVQERLRRDLDQARVHELDFDLEAGLGKLGAALDGLENSTFAAKADATWVEHAHSLTTKWWTWSIMSVATLGVVWWTHSSPAPRAESRRSAPVESAPPARELSEATAPADEAPRSEQPGRVSETEPAPSRASAVRARRSAEARSVRSAEAGKRANSARLAAARPARERAEATGDSERLPEAARATEAAAATHGSVGDLSRDRPEASELHRADDVRRRSEGEVEHLARARGLLPHDPDRALKAAREGQTTFASGLFREERSALIVFALARLNRADEARREAEVYLRTYPRGPFAVPVREIVTRFEAQRR